MKKLVILTILWLLLVSCGKQSTINTEIENDNQDLLIIENQDNSINEEIIEEWKSEYNDELVEDEVIEELKEITHDNFKPLLETLKWLDKEELWYYDCESYFYLPEPENRPKFQLDIQEEYIAKCEELKK